MHSKADRKVLFKIFRILNGELAYRYQSSMSSEKTIKRVAEDAKKKKKRAVYSGFWQIFQSLLIGVLLLVFVILPGFLGGDLMGIPRAQYISAMASLLIIITLIWSFMQVMFQSWLFQEHKLLEPLTFLPIEKVLLRKAILLPISIPVMGLIIPFIGFGIMAGWNNLILALGYFVITVYIGFSAGLYCGSIIAERGTGSTAKRFASTLLMFLFMFFLIMVYQMGNLLEYFLGPLTISFPHIEWVYPFSFANSIDKGWLSLIPMVLYIGLGLLLYNRSFEKFWHKVTGQTRVYAHKENRKMKMGVCPPMTAMWIKDAKMLSREPRLMYSMFYMPLLMIVFSFTLEDIGLWAIFSIVGVFGSFIAAYSLIQLDAKYWPFISTLPIKKRSCIWSKTLLVSLPIILVCAGMGFIHSSIDIAIFPATLTLTFAIIFLALIINSMPKNATAIVLGRKNIGLLILIGMGIVAVILISAVFAINTNLVSLGILGVTILASSRK